MAEYIEREALLSELAKGTIITDDGYGMGIMAGMDFAMKKVAEVPAADVAPVVHGRWEFDKVEMEVYCSVCGHNAPIGMSSYIRHKYCPNCGARMDGE